MPNPVISAIRGNHPYFRTTAEYAIQHGIMQTYQRVGQGKNPTEPAFVASLIFDTLPMLHCLWAPVLLAHGILLRVSGVFCHQSPMVKWPKLKSSKPNRCELGDLLVLHSHKSLVGQTDIRAVLFQAKKAKNGIAILKNNELVQLALYMQLPPFQYDRGRLSGQCRKIEKWTTNPLRYLLLHPTISSINLQSPALVHAEQPTPVVKPTLPFAISLIRLLTGKYGRRVLLSQSTGWSQVVKDLLSAAAQLSFSLKSANYMKGDKKRLWTSPPIGLTLQAMNGFSFSKDSASYSEGDTSLIMSLLSEFDGGQSTGKPIDMVPEELSGVSIVLFETTEEERRG